MASLVSKAAKLLASVKYKLDPSLRFEVEWLDISLTWPVTFPVNAAVTTPKVTLSEVPTAWPIAKVMLLPLNAEVTPVPPSKPNVSESRSIEPELVPSLISRSSDVMAAST